jgi:hypothetical protein
MASLTRRALKSAKRLDDKGAQQALGGIIALFQKDVEQEKARLAKEAEQYRLFIEQKAQEARAQYIQEQAVRIQKIYEDSLQTVLSENDNFQTVITELREAVQTLQDRLTQERDRSITETAMLKQRITELESNQPQPDAPRRNKERQRLYRQEQRGLDNG